MVVRCKKKHKGNEELLSTCLLHAAAHESMPLPDAATRGSTLLPAPATRGGKFCQTLGPSLSCTILCVKSPLSLTRVHRGTCMRKPLSTSGSSEHMCGEEKCKRHAQTLNVPMKLKLRSLVV